MVQYQGFWVAGTLLLKLLELLKADLGNTGVESNKPVLWFAIHRFLKQPGTWWFAQGMLTDRLNEWVEIGSPQSSRPEQVAASQLGCRGGVDVGG